MPIMKPLMIWMSGTSIADRVYSVIRSILQSMIRRLQRVLRFLQVADFCICLAVLTSTNSICMQAMWIARESQLEFTMALQHKA